MDFVSQSWNVDIRKKSMPTKSFPVIPTKLLTSPHGGLDLKIQLFNVVQEVEAVSEWGILNPRCAITSLAKRSKDVYDSFRISPSPYEDVDIFLGKLHRSVLAACISAIETQYADPCESESRWQELKNRSGLSIKMSLIALKKPDAGMIRSPKLQDFLIVRGFVPWLARRRGSYEELFETLETLDAWETGSRQTVRGWLDRIDRVLGPITGGLLKEQPQIRSMSGSNVPSPASASRMAGAPLLSGSRSAMSASTAVPIPLPSIQQRGEQQPKPALSALAARAKLDPALKLLTDEVAKSKASPDRMQLFKMYVDQLGDVPPRQPLTKTSANPCLPSSSGGPVQKDNTAKHQHQILTPPPSSEDLKTLPYQLMRPVGEDANSQLLDKRQLKDFRLMEVLGGISEKKATHEDFEYAVEAARYCAEHCEELDPITTKQNQQDAQVTASPSTEIAKGSSNNGMESLVGFYSLFDKLERTSPMGARYLESYGEKLRDELCKYCWFDHNVWNQDEGEDGEELNARPKWSKPTQGDGLADGMVAISCG